MNEEKMKDFLIKYFERQKANWSVQHSSKPRSQTGWDLIVSRHNCVLFIEVKYIKGVFNSPFIECIGAVLMRRGKDILTRKGFPPWCSNYCIAFNTKRDKEYDMIRALFYKLSQPEVLDNWLLLSRANAKYVYFIKGNGLVAKVGWKKIAKLAEKFKKKLGKEKIILSKRIKPREIEIIKEMELKFE